MNVAPLDPLQVPALPHGVLAALMDLAGESSTLSLRSRLGPATPLSATTIAELVAYGLVDTEGADVALTPTFRQILAPIMDPVSLLDIHAWGEGRTIELRGVFDDNHAVAVNDTGGTIVISGPLHPSAVGEVLAPFLAALHPTTAPESALELDIHLRHADAMAFAAVFEAARAATAAGVPPTGLPIRALTDHGRAHWSTLAADDLRLLTQVIAGLGEPTTSQDISEGVRRLGTTGLVTVDEAHGSVDPCAALIELARRLPPNAPGWRWERTTRHGARWSRNDHAVLIGEDGVGLLVAPGQPGHVGVRTTDADEQRTGVSAELSVLHLPPSTP